MSLAFHHSLSIVQFCEVAMAFKRKRTYAPRRTFRKRRRTFRRRGKTSRMGRTSHASTARGDMSMFKRKKFSASRFRRDLFQETKYKAHYRSFGAQVYARFTGLSPTDSNVFYNNPLSTLFPFWLATGGAQPLDTGIAVPPFSGDIILRGGKFNMTIFNWSGPSEIGTASEISGSALKVRVWFGYSGPTVNLAVIPAVANNGWDPSAIPEFRDVIGKVYHHEEVMLHNGDTYQFSRRLRASKIDQNRWTAGANVPFVIYQVIKLDNYPNDAGYDVKFDFNCAFSADAF